MDHQRVVGLVRHADPELAENRKFLRSALPLDVDRQSPGREAVELVAPEEAIVARAEEDDELVEQVRLVQRRMDAQAGEAEIDRQGLVELRPPHVVEARLVGDRRRHAAAHEVHRHGTGVEEAEVEELEPERAPLPEERLVRLEADVAPGVVVELGDRRRQGRDAGLVGDLGEVLRPALHVGEAEGRLRPPFAALRPRLARSPRGASWPRVPGRCLRRLSSDIVLRSGATSRENRALDGPSAAALGRAHRRLGGGVRGVSATAREDNPVSGEKSRFSLVARTP